MLRPTKLKGKRAKQNWLKTYSAKMVIGCLLVSNYPLLEEGFSQYAYVKKEYISAPEICSL